MLEPEGFCARHSWQMFCIRKLQSGLMLCLSVCVQRCFLHLFTNLVKMTPARAYVCMPVCMHACMSTHTHDSKSFRLTIVSRKLGAKPYRCFKWKKALQKDIVPERIGAPLFLLVGRARHCRLAAQESFRVSHAHHLANRELHGQGCLVAWKQRRHAAPP